MIDLRSRWIRLVIDLEISINGDERALEYSNEALRLKQKYPVRKQRPEGTIYFLFLFLFFDPHKLVNFFLTNRNRFNRIITPQMKPIGFWPRAGTGVSICIRPRTFYSLNAGVRSPWNGWNLSWVEELMKIRWVRFHSIFCFGHESHRSVLMKGSWDWYWPEWLLVVLHRWIATIGICWNWRLALVLMTKSSESKKRPSS